MTGSSRLAPLFLALLLVVAGCSGLTGSDTPTPTDGIATDGATPTPTPGTSDGGDATTASSSPSSPSGEAVPGVRDGRLVGPAALLVANGAALNGSAYAAEVSGVIRPTGDADIRPLTIRKRARVSSGGYPYRYLLNQTGGRTADAVDRVWANESLRLDSRSQITARGGTTRYRRAADPSPLPGNFVARGVFSDAVLVGDFRVVAAESSEDRVTLVADGIRDSPPEATDLNVDRIENYSGRLVVDREGRIRSGSISLTRTSERLSVEFSIGYELQQLGDVTVERPSWFGQALAEAPHYDLTATLVDDGYVRLRNAGPDPIAEGRTVRFGRGAGVAPTELARPIPPNSTVYLWATPSEPRLQITSEPPSEETRSLSGARELTVSEVTETRREYPITTVRVNGTGG